MSKTACSTSLEQFLATAETISVTIVAEDGEQYALEAKPKQFSTGSFGYYANGKIPAAPKYVAVAAESFEASARENSTGSLGALAQGKATVGGLPCQVTAQMTAIGTKPGSKAKADGSYTCGVNVTVIGSKDAPRA